MIDRPTYTQIPNIFLDKMAARMGEAELRVALVVMRETFGWHRDSKRLSLTYLQNATGMSRQGVINGIEAGLERGIIWRTPLENGSGYRYGLVVNNVDQNERSSQRGGLEVVNEVDQGSQRGGLEVVNEVGPIKERSKKSTKEKDQIDQGSHSGNGDELTPAAIAQLFNDTMVVGFSRNTETYAARILSEFDWPEVCRAAQAVIEEHQRKIDGGEQGISYPVDYLHGVLIRDQQGRRPTGFGTNGGQIHDSANNANGNGRSAERVERPASFPEQYWAIADEHQRRGIIAQPDEWDGWIEILAGV